MMRILTCGVLVASLALVSRAERVVLVAPVGEGKLVSPFGVVHDSGGRLLIVEFSSRVQAMDGQGRLATIAGDGVKGESGDGGPATAARVNAPHCIAVGADGTIYVADTMNHRIRRIDPKSGIISAFAGSAKGYGGDGGAAAGAKFNELYCIALNPDKTKMVVTDLGNRRIRVIDMASAVVSLLAGNGERGVPADGAVAVASPLVDPRAAAMDSKGNVYLLERSGHALRVVDSAGKIKTLIAGPADAKGPRTLNGPKHLCIDGEDNVIIADTDNHRIVKWLPAEGKLVPVAGTGKKGNGGVGGTPERLELNQPHGVYVDSRGTLFISDSMNDRVLKIEK
jgi:DNA-binding beta-propeller fold protein YncE